MAGCFAEPRLSDRFGLPGRLWMTLLVMTLLTSGATAADPCDVDAALWRSRQIETIATKVQHANSKDERLEYEARGSWLRRWEPGQMPSAPADAPDESELVPEPLLQDLTRPAGVDLSAWRQMVDSQTRLLDVDSDDARKDNLRTTIRIASKLETDLAAQLADDSKTLATPTSWVLAYTRYRLGRALAYRELPVVREGWPIVDTDRYQKRLLAVYDRLTQQTHGDRAEFILLQDRMFRRSGNKGLALELLEANRRSIQPKWYLKKRRDLLQEIGWDPPYREAAKLYLEAGYDDES
ncbi:hypothetical protein [Rubripirellula lacrimiformis]|nr:hypothetical protein [Rubripirellula lacrimiformis]